MFGFIRAINKCSQNYTLILNQYFQMQDARNIVLATVATRSIPDLEYLLSSAMTNGMYVNVLGMGDPRLTKYKQLWHAKIHLLRDFLITGLADGTIKPNDLIVFLDAYDVIQRGGKNDIMKAWRNAGSPEILISAETNCFPANNKSRAEQNRLAFEKGYTGRFKYVNAGTIAGLANALHKALTTFPELQGEGNDQDMWTRAYIAHHRDMHFSMDRNRDMFAVLWDDGTAIDILKRTAPFLHFNGIETKGYMPAVFQDLFQQRLTTDSCDVVHIVLFVILPSVTCVFVALFVVAYFRKFPRQNKS